MPASSPVCEVLSVSATLSSFQFSVFPSFSRLSHDFSTSTITVSYIQSAPHIPPTTTMTSEAQEGASYAEQILECARRNNTELLQTIVSELGEDHAQLAQLLNSTKEVITANSPLHIATLLGNWEFIDMVLDIEGVEIDPLNREGDTPLHLAVKFAGSDPDYGYFIIDNLLDAGLDAKIVDKHGLKPVSYVVNNEKLRNLLQSAEYAGETVAVADDSQGDDDDDEASASDSD